jgi:hypothetical protein
MLRTLGPRNSLLDRHCDARQVELDRLLRASLLVSWSQHPTLYDTFR